MLAADQKRAGAGVKAASHPTEKSDETQTLSDCVPWATSCLSVPTGLERKSRGMSHMERERRL